MRKDACVCMCNSLKLQFTLFGKHLSLVPPRAKKSDQLAWLAEKAHTGKPFQENLGCPQSHQPIFALPTKATPNLLGEIWVERPYGGQGPCGSLREDRLAARSLGLGTRRREDVQPVQGTLRRAKGEIGVTRWGYSALMYKLRMTARQLWI